MLETDFIFALPENLKDWIEVAKDVGNIMRNPEMDTDTVFLEYAERKIRQNEAIMAWNADKKESAGFIGFSHHNNSITWLGVKEKYRNQGIGSHLLSCALENLDHNRRITVNTYPEHYLPGRPARRLYFKHGFIETISTPFYIYEPNHKYETVELSIMPKTNIKS